MNCHDSKQKLILFGILNLRQSGRSRSEEKQMTEAGDNCKILLLPANTVDLIANQKLPDYGLSA